MILLPLLPVEIRLSQPQHYDILGWVILYCGDSVLCMCGNTPARYPLDTRSISLLDMIMKTCLQTWPNVPCGGGPGGGGGIVPG